MPVILTVSRHHKLYQHSFGTVSDAAEDALNHLEYELGWPVCIEVDGQSVWEHNGPFENMRKALADLLLPDARSRLRELEIIG